MASIPSLKLSHSSDDEYVSPQGKFLESQHQRTRSLSMNTNPGHQVIKFLQVLFVEDLPLFHVGMSATAVKLDWTLTIVETSQEAFQLAKERDYDLILMDGNLRKDSEWNGYETARKIKEIKPQQLILSFSSNALETSAQLGPEMDGHIEKNASLKYLQIMLPSYFTPSKNALKTQIY